MRIRLNVALVIDGEGVRVENVDFDLLGRREPGQSIEAAVQQIEASLSQVSHSLPPQPTATTFELRSIPVAQQLPAQQQRSAMDVEVTLLKFGFTQEEVTELAKTHGLDRLKRLVGWVKAKQASQGVASPRSLICSCLAKEAISKLPSPMAV